MNAELKELMPFFEALKNVLPADCFTSEPDCVEAQFTVDRSGAPHARGDSSSVYAPRRWYVDVSVGAGAPSPGLRLSLRRATLAIGYASGDYALHDNWARLLDEITGGLHVWVTWEQHGNDGELVAEARSTLRIILNATPEQVWDAIANAQIAATRGQP